MSKEDKLLNSNYDGIEEYDNDLPRWWVYLFLLTGVFSVVYIVYFHLAPGVDVAANLEKDLQELNAQHAASSTEATGTKVDDSTLLTASKDAATVSKGKEVFTAKCAACHGMNAEGLIGPNLTDKYWIHGGKMTDLLRVTNEGVLDKGMLAWRGIIPEPDIVAVVSYIWSLQGSNPANAKPPQGSLVE